MIFPDTQIEQALLQPDDERELSDKQKVLHDFYLDADTETLYAADGFIIAAVPTEVHEGDESGVIPAYLIHDMRAGIVRDVQSLGRTVLVDGEFVTVERPNYPDPRLIFNPLSEEYDGTEPTITLDVDLLLRLANAITPTDHPRMLSLWIGGVEDPVYVKSIFERGGIGVIMPVHKGE